MMKWTRENFRAEIEASAPMKRIGRPEDMAGIAIYLASPAATFVTGAVIPVDGGMSTAQTSIPMPVQ